MYKLDKLELSITWGRGVTLEGADVTYVSHEEIARQRREHADRMYGNGGYGGGNEPPSSGGPPNFPSFLQEMFELGKQAHSPDYVVAKSGYISSIPEGFIGPWPTRAAGARFSGSKITENHAGKDKHGFSIKVTDVRIMDGNTNQGPRTVYEKRLPNERGKGQPVDPYTGKPVSRDKAHFYHDPNDQQREPD